MQKINTGVIGTGFIGPVHVEAVRRTGLADVLAIADINEEVARKKADGLGVERAYGSADAVLADPDIDVVHICVPNNLHYEIAKKALKAGKHVVCEKPLAMTPEEGKELKELAETCGLVCAMNLNVRAYPLLQHVRSMVSDGTIGEIFAVNGSYQQDWLFKDTDYSWRLEPEFSGKTRAVADIGTHWFDLVEYITGKRIEKVFADFATFHPVRKKPLKPVETYSGKILQPEDYQEVPIGTEDYANVQLRFAGGAHGSFTANQVAAGRKNRIWLEIYGSKCSVAYDSEMPNQLWIGHRDGCNEVMIKDPSLMSPDARAYNSYPGGHCEGFADTVKHTMIRIYRDITRDPAGRKGDYPQFRDGYRELQLCEAIYESARTDRWVEI